MTDEQKRFFTAKALLVNPDWTHDDYRIQHFLDGCDSLIEYLDQREKINVDFESGYELRRTENEDHIRSLEAQLSSKSQECEELNKTVEAFRVRDEKRELRFSKANKENGGLYAKNEALESELSSLRAENDRLTEIEYCQKCTINNISAEFAQLKGENERLRTTLVAGAELIKENWSKLCDEEGYGPQNLLLRMDGTLNTSGYPGYSAGNFAKQDEEILTLRKRCEDLEAAATHLIHNAGLISLVSAVQGSLLEESYQKLSKLLSQ